MACKRIIYYLQTVEQGISQILRPEPLVTHIHLSAIHFGKNLDGSDYIHLNDSLPSSPSYNEIWNQLYEASQIGIRVVLMIGGAGGAYKALFSNFEVYYQLLTETLRTHPQITGVDLDIEEDVRLEDVKMLINRIHKDFPYFIISMAPVQYSLQTNEPGLGGFSYKELFNSPEGKLISYFNGQFYIDFSVNAYEQCISNGYPPQMIVMGMLSSQFNSSEFDSACKIIEYLADRYSDIGGAYNWEYYDAEPGGTNNPQLWSERIHKALYHQSVDGSCSIQ